MRTSSGTAIDALSLDSLGIPLQLCSQKMRTDLPSIRRCPCHFSLQRETLSSWLTEIHLSVLSKLKKETEAVIMKVCVVTSFPEADEEAG